MLSVRRLCHALSVATSPTAAALAAVLVAGSGAPAAAQSVQEFYKGKTITIAVGFTPREASAPPIIFSMPRRKTARPWLW
jgi:hypothetical protein